MITGNLECLENRWLGARCWSSWKGVWETCSEHHSPGGSTAKTAITYIWHNGPG